VEVSSQILNVENTWMDVGGDKLLPPSSPGYAA
jgi:hypothetical protein